MHSNFSFFSSLILCTQTWTCHFEQRERERAKERNQIRKTSSLFDVSPLQSKLTKNPFINKRIRYVNGSWARNEHMIFRWWSKDMMQYLHIKKNFSYLCCPFIVWNMCARVVFVVNVCFKMVKILISFKSYNDQRISLFLSLFSFFVWAEILIFSGFSEFVPQSMVDVLLYKMCLWCLQG